MLYRKTPLISNCENNCSGHGKCDEAKKVCICDVYIFNLLTIRGDIPEQSVTFKAAQPREEFPLPIRYIQWALEMPEKM